MNTPHLLESMLVHVTWFSGDVTHVMFSWKDDDSANDIAGHRRYDCPASIEEAADDVGRLVAAWAACGRAGVIGVTMRAFDPLP